MSAPLITLNATVAEIEAALLTGKSVKTVALDLQEPPNNVYGVYRALVERGEIKEDGAAVTKRPDLTVARQQPATSQTTGRTGSAPRPVPAPTPPLVPPVTGGGAEPTLDALIAAAGRSSSKRTQALGAKLGELAGVVRARLSEERDAAEKAEREKAVREAAVAEVAALEAKLAEARAKLGKGRGGSRPVSRRSSTTKTTGNPTGAKSPRPAYEGGPPSSVIRAWAKANDYEISDRGQLPPGVIEDYRCEHGGAS